jgi:uncharacterized protein (TIGR03435 family)
MTRTGAGFLLTLAVALAQKPQAFDVASVKPNLSATGGFSMGTSQGRLSATNVPVRMLIQKGFHVKEFQLSGGPGWLDTARYDVVAKTENTSISDDDLWLLLQPLLADRFKLRFHRETKRLQVYSLVVAKGGPKLKAHTGSSDGKDEPTMSGRVSSGKASLDAKKTSMVKLADVLGDHMDRTVIDNTGLKGDYDFKLEWAQEHPGEENGSSILGSLQEGLGMSGPSVFTAVQEQLGLKLESAKGPVGMIVIDSVEKASAN